MYQEFQDFHNSLEPEPSLEHETPSLKKASVILTDGALKRVLPTLALYTAPIHGSVVDLVVGLRCNGSHG